MFKLNLKIGSLKVSHIYAKITENFAYTMNMGLRSEVADISILTSSHPFPDNASDMAFLVGIHLGS